MAKSGSNSEEQKGFIIGPHGVVIPIPPDAADYEWVDSSLGIKMPKTRIYCSTQKPLKIGIMGGTFDPVHYGHLVTAEAASDLFSLSTVIFVPSGRPPHKRAFSVTDPWERYGMTELATCSNLRFRMCDIEVCRPGYSYTIDTVRAFRTAYGEEAELYFITGADAILEIMTWHRIDELMKECHFIAAYRPGYDREHLRDAVEQMSRDFSQRIHLIEVPALAISSTDIRRRLQEGRTIKYLLPEPVIHRIAERGLYVGSGTHE
ncbi:nicotinate-nucleotide adenylyltransferase [Heliobacterium mobile]|nr:nicotinate-nucleotide adenylyltransferase [Heliobacterium mobile]